MSDIDRAELRRLLAEAETPWTIQHTTPNMGGPNWLIRRECKAGIIISAHEYGFHGRGEVIAAAVNALPDLLDALDVAEATIERVREMHAPIPKTVFDGISFVPHDTLTDCGWCDTAYPCPTIQALDGGGSDERLDRWTRLYLGRRSPTRRRTASHHPDQTGKRP